MFKFKKKSLLALTLLCSMALSVFGCSKEDISDKTTEQTTTEQTTTEATASETDSNIPDSTDTNTVMADPTTPEALDEQAKFDEWLSDSFEESVVSDTITLHYTLAHPEDYDITPSEVTYGDNDLSEEGAEKDKQETEESLAELEDFNYELLTSDQKFTYDILLDDIKTDIESYDYLYLYEPFSYTSGLHSNLPITLAEYTFYDQGDVDDYLKLLELTPDYFQICLDFEKAKSDKGYFMSSNSANEVIRQCSEYIATPEENLLIETFNNRIGNVDGLTDEQIESYKQLNHDAVIDYIIPTYENIITVFKSLKTTGKNSLGLAHIDEGKDYYKYLLKNKTGSDKTPEEVIELLDSKLNSNLSELQSVAMENYDGYVAYIEDYDDLYSENDPKETILYFEDAFKDRFPEIPAINFTVDPVHNSLEEIVSPAFYMTPAMDDYENNSIYINNGSDGAGSLWSTLAHEGIPGHMYQFVYFLSSDPEPLRTLLSFNGYQEGWATYTEMMSYQYYEDYANECYADLERLNSELNLLVSARVEIGVNYEGWTLEDTQNYLSESGFNPEAAKDVMDYVIAEPANYQMYVLGWLEFEELRSYAEDSLGEKFDEIEYHKVVLDAGPCQFNLLKTKVDQYINSIK